MTCSVCILLYIGLLGMAFLVGCRSVASQLTDASAEERHEGMTAYESLSSSKRQEIDLELTRIAESHPENIRRYLAIPFVSDAGVLTKIAREDSVFMNRQRAITCLNNQAALAELAKGMDESELFECVMKGLNDQHLLVEVAKTATAESIRISATRKIGDQSALASIVQSNDTESVRREALEGITLQPELVTLAKSELDLDICLTAVSRLTDQLSLADVAKHAREEVRIKAAAALTVQDELIHIVKNDSSARVRKTAIANLKDANVLADVAQTDPDLSVREIATEALPDSHPLKQRYYANIVKNEQSRFTRREQFEALRAVTDQALLIDIAKTLADSEIRCEAIGMVADLQTLEGIVHSTTDLVVEAEARERIRVLQQELVDDPDVTQEKLVEIIKAAEHRDVYTSAIRKLRNNTLLVEIAQSDLSVEKICCALQSLTDLPALAGFIDNADESIKTVAAEQFINRLGQGDPAELEACKTALQAKWPALLLLVIADETPPLRRLIGAGNESSLPEERRSAIRNILSVTGKEDLEALFERVSPETKYLFLSTICEQKLALTGDFAQIGEVIAAETKALLRGEKEFGPAFYLISGTTSEILFLMAQQLLHCTFSEPATFEWTIRNGDDFLAFRKVFGDVNVNIFNSFLKQNGYDPLKFVNNGYLRKLERETLESAIEDAREEFRLFRLAMTEVMLDPYSNMGAASVFGFPGVADIVQDTEREKMQKIVDDLQKKMQAVTRNLADHFISENDTFTIRVFVNEDDRDEITRVVLTRSVL